MCRPKPAWVLRRPSPSSSLVFPVVEIQTYSSLFKAIQGYSSLNNFSVMKSVPKCAPTSCETVLPLNAASGQPANRTERNATRLPLPGASNQA
ncbi:hypothetical protein SBV1_1600044 [Verrucomicrobia bacterium]|nr:hypothetical protein SBV1_1600044 [Verrucomicrobiota bacterium]